MKTKTLVFKLSLLTLLLVGYIADAQTYSRIRDEYYGSGLPIFGPSSYPAIAADTVNKVVYYRLNSSSVWRKVDGYFAQFYFPSPGGTVIGDTTSIYVMPNGVDDTQNLQLAISISKSKGKPIQLYAANYYLSSGLVISKDHYYLVIDGNMAAIRMKNQNAFTALMRTPPTDNAEALAGMYQAWYKIENIRFYGYNTQKGIEISATGGSEFNNLRFDGFGTGLTLRFCLNATVYKNYYINCVNGLYVGIGNWTGADNANSQSNHTTISKLECYMPSNGNVAIGVYDCSGVTVSNSIIEGFKCVNGIEFISNSNVVKDFTATGIHFECVQGASNAFFKGRIAGGTMIIDKVFGQYAALFMDVASTSGLGYVEVRNVPWWIGQGGSGNGNGKMFRVSNISQHYHKNEAWGDMPSTVWDGTAPQKCGDGSDGQSFCGYNRYTFTKIPR